MDFFAHQEAARKRTSLLLFYYVVAVLMLVTLAYFAGWLATGAAHVKLGTPAFGWWNARLFLWTTGGTLGVIALGTLFRILDLREGGRAVAEMLGGRRLSLSPEDDRERQLRNVVEEMAIASGVPIPEIYVMDGERGINAFAAGYSQSDTAVAVTRGCLERLTRDELQGVIAHEFSHMLNGDMRLNIRLLAVLNGILGLYLVGRVVVEIVNWGGVRGRDRAGAAIAALVGGGALMAIGGLGVLFARLIQAAVSRQREFLADASAVQFTRHPAGIANALKKIGAVPNGSKLRNPQAQAASHFFFSNGLSEPWFGLTATHPPLAERIQRIEPGFDGTFPTLEDVAPEDFLADSRPGAPLHVAALGPLVAAGSVPRERIVRRVGQPLHVQYGAGVLGTLPDPLRSAAADPFSAAGLICALVLHGSDGARGKQLDQLRGRNAALARQAEAFAPAILELTAQARLPLVNLCLPALRTLSSSQWQQFRVALEELITADAQIDLFEFVLRRIIERNIDAHWQPKEAAAVQFYSFLPLAPDCAVLLSALAHVGQADEAATHQAFDEGTAVFPANMQFAFVPVEQCGVERIDAALARLGQAVPHIKRVALEACARTVACDGRVQAGEAELLRAIAESLGCPIPPFVWDPLESTCRHASLSIL